MKRLSFVVLTSSLVSSQLLASDSKNWKLDELVAQGLANNSEIQEVTKESQRASAQTGVGRTSFFPELGIEGGARSNREREKRTDEFYYGYGRYNLFRGFKDFHGYQALLNTENFAKFKAERIRHSVSRDIAKLFYGILFLDESIKLRRADFKLSESQIEMAKKKEAAGLTTKADLYDFQLHQSALLSDISLLEQEKSEKLRKLSRLVGIADDQLTRIEGSLELSSNLPTFDTLLEHAVSQNQDLQEASHLKQVSIYETRAAVAGWAPSIDIEAQYGKLFDTDFAESRKSSWAVIGKITLPLFSGFSTFYDHKAQQSELDRRELTLGRIRSELEVEVRNLYGQAQSLRERLKIERDRKEQAKKYYETTLSEYRRGVKNSPDLAGATDRMLDSQLREAELLRDLQVNHLKLAETMGEGVSSN